MQKYSAVQKPTLNYLYVAGKMENRCIYSANIVYVTKNFWYTWKSIFAVAIFTDQNSLNFLIKLS